MTATDDPFILNNEGERIYPKLVSLLKEVGRHGFPLCLTQNDGVTKIKHGLGLTLYRKNQLQVQQWIFEPNQKITDHSHPNVASYEVYISGDMTLTKEGKVVSSLDHAKTRPDGICACIGGVIYIPPGCVHGGWTGPKGGCFLSVQYWLNGAPKSIHLDWEGVDGSTKG